MGLLGFGLGDEVARDLRGPLVVMEGCIAKMLADGHGRDEPQRELLETVLAGTRELVASIEGLEARLDAFERLALGLDATDRPLALDVPGTPGPS
jgi:signal transduction histidine kinase